MPEQVRAKHAPREAAESIPEVTEPTPDDHLRAETEAILDEIDAALEEQELNTEEAAATMIREWVQKGGE